MLQEDKLHSADVAEPLTNGLGTKEETRSATVAVEAPPRKGGRWWVRLGLAGIVLLATGLRVWRLDQNGYGTDYYAATVRSMMQSWHNFFYASFDPGGFVSVDKPPVALWIQVVSAKLFGFSGLSVILPQVLEGIGAVLLVYHLVQRRFSAGAALFAALALAVTPISVAVDRGSNTDSCLVFVLLLAAWALIRAAETGKWTLVVLSLALVGVGFNVKMGAALVVVPTFCLVYFLGAPISWRTRLGDLTLAGVVMAVVSASWMVAFDLTPPENRPFAGSSRDNSMLSLAADHNGLQRFIRRGRFPGAPPGNLPGRDNALGTTGTTPSGGDGQQVPGDGVIDPVTGQPVPPWMQAGAGPGAAGRPGGPRAFMGRNAPVGPLRLANRHLAGQMAWLFPVALLGLVIAVFQARLTWPIGPAHLTLLLCFGWALTYGVVYSLAGGIFHAYYLVTMAPPLAALAGVGLAGLWSCFRRGGWRILLLPVGLLLTAAWQVYIGYDYVGWKLDWSQIKNPSDFFAPVREHFDWRTWLYVGLLGGTLVAVAVLLIPRLRSSWRRAGGYLAPVGLAAGMLALLATPAAWALSSVLVRGNVMLPAADLTLLAPRDENAPQRFRGGFGAPGRNADNKKLIAFLQANYQDERWALVVQSSQQAAPIIIESGLPVMALGGFMGSDPTLGTEPEQIQEKLTQLVADREVRFFMVAGGFGRGGPGFGRGGPAAGATRAGGAPDTGTGTADTQADRAAVAGRQGATAVGGDPAGGGAGQGTTRAGGPNRPAAGGGFGGFGRGSAEVSRWVRAHGKEVPREYWGSPVPERTDVGRASGLAGAGAANADAPGQPVPNRRATTSVPNGSNRQRPTQRGAGRGFGMMGTLYDCRPDNGLVRPRTEASEPEAK